MGEVAVLSREQLAKFLPDDRAIRAFEKLINQVSVQLPSQINVVVTNAEALEAEVTALTASLAEVAELADQLQQLVGSAQRVNLAPVVDAIENLRQLVQPRPVNLDPILKRLDNIETFLVL